MQAITESRTSLKRSALPLSGALLVLLVAAGGTFATLPTVLGLTRVAVDWLTAVVNTHGIDLAPALIVVAALPVVAFVLRRANRVGVWGERLSALAVVLGVLVAVDMAVSAARVVPVAVNALLATLFAFLVLFGLVAWKLDRVSAADCRELPDSAKPHFQHPGLVSAFRDCEPGNHGARLGPVCSDLAATVPSRFACPRRSGEFRPCCASGRDPVVRREEVLGVPRRPAPGLEREISPDVDSFR
jgi:hypothetical protein